MAGFVGFFGASVKLFSSGIPREFWAMAMRLSGADEPDHPTITAPFT